MRRYLGLGAAACLMVLVAWDGNMAQGQVKAPPRPSIRPPRVGEDKPSKTDSGKATEEKKTDSSKAGEQGSKGAEGYREGGASNAPESYPGYVPGQEGYDPGAGAGMYPQGYHVLVPDIGRGCFGELFPVLRLQFVPGPWPYGPKPTWANSAGYGGHAAPHGDASHGWEGGLPIDNAGPSLKGTEVPADKAKEKGPELGPISMKLTSRKGEARITAAQAKEWKIATRRPEKAIDVTGLSAADADGFFWLGYRFFWQKKIEDAYVYIEAATQLSDQDARYWYYRSLCEKNLGMERQSAASLRQAVDLHVKGMPRQDLIGQALERVQGEDRMQLREALDARRASR